MVASYSEHQTEFLAEAAQILASVSQTLVRAPGFEEGAIDLLKLEDAIRQIRAVSAGARASGLPELSELAGGYEAILIRLRRTENRATVRPLLLSFQETLEKCIAGQNAPEATRLLHELRTFVAPLPSDSESTLSHEDLGRLTALATAGSFEHLDLRERLLQAAQDTATVLGKQVTLSIEGDIPAFPEATENLINESLFHLIRNAIDHGLENSGTVTVKFHSSLDGLIVECSDTGRGIDPQRIHSRALELGLIHPAKPITAEEVLEYLFVPGFSTSDKITEISGRGIGLDVVRANVDKLSGRIRIESTPGSGTTIRIEIPVATLAQRNPAA